MTFLLIVALGALVALAVVAALCWWLWRRGPYGRVAVTIGLAFLIYETSSALNPPSSFYRDEFAYRTGVAFPVSAKIKFAKASYPDFHGDYASEVLFEVSPQDFEWLQRAAKINPPTGDESIGGMYWRETEAAYGRTMEVSNYGSIKNPKSDQRGCWALLKDGKTIYFWFAQT